MSVSSSALYEVSELHWRPVSCSERNAASYAEAGGRLETLRSTDTISLPLTDSKTLTTLVSVLSRKVILRHE